MRHTKRRWNTNVQRVRIVENGVQKHLHLCAKCLKTRQKTA
jgi:ribosomal protein L28